MTCSYLMAQDQALKIWQRKLSIAVATWRQLSLLAQSKAFCASNGLRLGRALCQRYTRKKQEENPVQSRCSSGQELGKLWNQKLSCGQCQQLVQDDANAPHIRVRCATTAVPPFGCHIHWASHLNMGERLDTDCKGQDSALRLFTCLNWKKGAQRDVIFTGEHMLPNNPLQGMWIEMRSSKGMRKHVHTLCKLLHAIVLKI